MKRYIKISEIKNNGLCFNCKKKLPKRKKRYCSEVCRDEFYSKFLYSYFRERIIKERKKCEMCSSDVELEIHHKRPLKEGGELFDDNNIELLCHECHVKKHKNRNKKLRPETLFLDFIGQSNGL